MKAEPGIEVAGHPRWLPLPLDDDDVDAAAARLVARLAEGTSSDADQRDAWAAGIAGHTRSVLAHDPAGEDGVRAALGFLPQGWSLSTAGTALLRLLSLPDDLPDGDVVAAVVGGRPRHGDVDVDVLAEGGLLVRWRPVVLSHGERQVHEELLALWPLPHEGLLVALSFYSLDLVEAGRAVQPFRELAAGVTVVAGP